MHVVKQASSQLAIDLLWYSITFVYSYLVFRARKLALAGLDLTRNVPVLGEEDLQVSLIFFVFPSFSDAFERLLSSPLKYCIDREYCIREESCH